MVVTITEIDSVVGTSVDNATAASCDVCSESFVNDVIESKPPRDLFLVEPENLKVCSECLPDFNFWVNS